MNLSLTLYASKCVWPYYLLYVSKLTRRPNLSRRTKFSCTNWDREILLFRVQLTTTSRIGHLTRFIHYSLLYIISHARVRNTFYTPYCLKKNLNASRSSEHPSIREENVKTFRWNHSRLQIIQNLFMSFDGFPDGGSNIESTVPGENPPLCCTHNNSRLCELRIDYLIEDGWGPQWRPESAEIFISGNILWPSGSSQIFLYFC